ncbi:unnamed protein product [Pleuronectes platessa]|uniref:Uncharacterized protein n=1 Tax=Pleuronectes platessa TaxID=8262 RepID=A0A9N7Y5S7_PLEPL|nr:unnamed protein product [Pleuronectes platessa]
MGPYLETTARIQRGSIRNPDSCSTPLTKHSHGCDILKSQWTRLGNLPPSSANGLFHKLPQTAIGCVEEG